MTTETQTQSENHDTLRIPSREEFHKHYWGVIRWDDFRTDYNPTTEENEFKESIIAKRIAKDYWDEYYWILKKKKNDELKKQEHIIKKENDI